MRLTQTGVHLAAGLGAVVVGVTPWAWGQPLISASGRVLPWVNSVWSAENSQQIADWYTVQHVLHGMLVALIWQLAPGRVSRRGALALAILSGVAWEIVEHTDWVLDRFRATTIYRGYLGDSVLNAVCDYLFMLAGFALASRLGVRASLAVMLACELGSAVIARDSLILTTIRVVHPIPAVTDWQDERNPDAGR
ncbi:MAG: DUF2585 family protein [Rhodobacterales bacterium]|nr:DUF2585 family protein [Rhodobacterales bacterium]